MGVDVDGSPVRPPRPMAARASPTDLASTTCRSLRSDTFLSAVPIWRAISRVENQEPDASALLTALYPHSGQAHIIGVTGAPGTGKSTLVTALAQSYRAAGLTVGIVAIDPTSPFTGAALLGDRGRLRALAGR